MIKSKESIVITKEYKMEKKVNAKIERPTYRKLMIIKVNNDLRTVSEAIEFLIQKALESQKND